MKKRVYHGILIVAAIASALMLSSCGGDDWKEKEEKAFSDQLHKDPNTWTSKEQTRYNDFSEWVSKQ